MIDFVQLLVWENVVIVVDVIVVAFLIYRLLLLLQGTRANLMLAGLGIIFAVYFVATKFNLVTLDWLLGEFLGSAILVIVVLFQEDLRRALIKVGLMPGFTYDLSASLDCSMKEIATAAAALSEKRIGALIVVARDVGLEDYTEQAIPVGGEVSHQLLETIFLPAGPIHDGAVVIDRDRIIAAGVVLPLTFNPAISKALGTRHRAAIGLSERTDAVIVVVSEETGTISLVREGRITRDLNERTLYNALHRLTVLRQQRRRKKADGGWFRLFRRSSKKAAAEASAVTREASATNE